MTAYVSGDNVEQGLLPRHVVFCPNPTYGDLGNTCRTQEKDGYALVRIVPVSLYEAVAVFEPMTGHSGSSVDPEENQ